MSSSIPRKVIIAGAGRFGRELAAWLRVYGGYDILGFIDDISQAPDLLGRITSHHAVPEAEYLVAVGAGEGRLHVTRTLHAKGCRMGTVISPDLHTAENLSNVEGGLLLGNCTISSNVRIGRQVLVQSYACIGHDVVLGDGVTVSSHTFLGGGAQVGNRVTLHPHSVILPDLRIGDDAVIGAGSVVTKDVEPGTTMFGNPAKMIARHLRKAA